MINQQWWVDNSQCETKVLRGCQSRCHFVHHDSMYLAKMTSQYPTTKHCRSYRNLSDHLTIFPQLHRLVLNGKMKLGRVWKQFWHILIYLCRETENKHIKTAGNHAKKVAANPFLEMVFTLLLNVSGTSDGQWLPMTHKCPSQALPYNSTHLSVHMKLI